MARQEAKIEDVLVRIQLGCLRGMIDSAEAAANNVLDKPQESITDSRWMQGFLDGIQTNARFIRSFCSQLTEGIERLEEDIIRLERRTTEKAPMAVGALK